MIFPGMDPYLEDPRRWRGLHTSLIVYMRNALQPLLLPRYVAEIEERVIVEGPFARERIADVLVKKTRKGRRGTIAVLDADDPVVVTVDELEIRERYVTIVDLEAGQKVVTIIELISPTNKYLGPGRDSYLAKQREILDSDVHLVEIDLLRTGQHVLAVPEAVARCEGPYDYLACVNRALKGRQRFDLYPRTIRQRLPRIRVPLANADADVVLDVQAVLEQAYEDGAYRDRIDYRQPCKPRLAAEEQRWVNQLIKKASSSRTKKHE